PPHLLTINGPERQAGCDRLLLWDMPAVDDSFSSVGRTPNLCVVGGSGDPFDCCTGWGNYDQRDWVGSGIVDSKVILFLDDGGIAKAFAEDRAATQRFEVPRSPRVAEIDCSAIQIRVVPMNPLHPRRCCRWASIDGEDLDVGQLAGMLWRLFRVPAPVRRPTVASRPCPRSHGGESSLVTCAQDPGSVPVPPWRRGRI